MPDTARDPGPIRRLWSQLDGPADLLADVDVTGPGTVLPAAFDVTGLAAAAVAVAGLALAEYAAAIDGRRRAVTVDTRSAAAAFRSEALLAPIGWERPPVWDPIAGDYEAADGWIRLHTNYAHHRDAVLRVLQVAAEHGAVATEVRRWSADALEGAVVAAGGAAAALRTAHAWRAHPHGRASAAAPPVELADTGAAAPAHRPIDTAAPLAGLRVLDLTRVIAGPVCTRYLAAYGADVVRIDPPGFAEVPALLPDTTVGKRCVALDLRDPGGRREFERLVAACHVMVSGYRPAALDRLGYGPAELRRINPALVVGRLDAYGWSGPWAGRRGFDSLVQMSTGIAAAGRAGGTGPPRPLPAQALDHGAGYLIAAGVLRALSRLRRAGRLSEVRGALVGVANVLTSLPGRAGGDPDPPDPQLIEDVTAWGPVRRVPVPGDVAGATARWRHPAGPVGARPVAEIDWRAS